MSTCSTLTCGKKVLAKGLCSKCYYRVKRGGTPEKSKKQMAAERLCSVNGCSKPHFVDQVIPASLMASFLLDETIYSNNREYYLSELFL